MTRKILIGLDRDGTLIKDNGYFGMNDSWKEEIEFLDGVIEGLKLFNGVRQVILLVATNQAGVARGYFDEERVKKINEHINEIFIENGIKICSWEYCPYVGKDYKEMHNLDQNEYVLDVSDKDISERKPNAGMIINAISRECVEINDCDVYYIGDRVSDVETALSLGGIGVLVLNGSNHAEAEKLEKEYLNCDKIKIFSSIYEALKYIRKKIVLFDDRGIV